MSRPIGLVLRRNDTIVAVIFIVPGGDQVVRQSSIDPLAMIRPRRKIMGISAVLLPFDDARAIDWAGFRGLVSRTLAAGLLPAVNMDTGYVNLVNKADRRAVLRETRAIVGRYSVRGRCVRRRSLRRGLESRGHVARIRGDRELRRHSRAVSFVRTQ